MRCVPTSKDTFPKLLQAEWVATNAIIIGDVECGRFTSFFHGVKLRGDTCKISIGKRTVIQDNSTLINSNIADKEAKIIIGDNVVIGVNCIVESCVIEDNVVIGNGATIHSNCVIQNGAMIAAGAILPPGTKVPANQVTLRNLDMGRKPSKVPKGNKTRGKRGNHRKQNRTKRVS